MLQNYLYGSDPNDDRTATRGRKGPQRCVDRFGTPLIHTFAEYDSQAEVLYKRFNHTDFNIFGFI